MRICLCKVTVSSGLVMLAGCCSHGFLEVLRCEGLVTLRFQSVSHDEFRSDSDRTAEMTVPVVEI